MRVLTSQQMREADRKTIEEIGLPSAVLMENAGRQVVAAIDDAFEHLSTMRVAVLCGRGNNGGDGFVVARTLLERDVDAGVYLVGAVADVKGDARVNLEVLRNLGVDIVDVGSAPAWELHGTDVVGSDLIVDALFGTGLHAPLDGLLKTIVDDVNSSTTPVVAVDLPSGLSADRTIVPGPAIDATLTVTLGAPKLPLILPPAESLAGDLVIADIGIPHVVMAGLDGPWVEMLTGDAMRAVVEPRAPESHKGDYGRVVIVAGSPGKTGAAFLAAQGALRSGAGLVTVAAPRSSIALIASMGAEYMTEALAETSVGSVSAAAVDRLLALDADVLVLGPGLGQDAETAAFVRAVVEGTSVPTVLDADALVAMAGHTEILGRRDGPDLVMTPHPGEMARLTGRSVDDIQSTRLETARDFATMHRVHLVLKGHRTIIATPGGKTYINLTGNPGMATGGTGDVLAGAIAAWIGQLLDAEAASTLAVYLHGLAGDLAEVDEGEVAMTATDVVDRLGDAVADLMGYRADGEA